MNSLTIFELLVISIGVSMDAFAVAICKGLSMKKINIKSMLIIALYFGVFQALMPLIGYLLGVQFQEGIRSIDHWIAFILLGVIGLNMIKEAWQSKTCKAKEDKSTSVCLDSKNNEIDSSLGFKTMSILAVATSIDALAVGITFAFLRVKILPSIIIIGIVTFTLSYFAVKIGSKFGARYKSSAELLGGIILIFMAFKILFEHLEIINF